MDGSMTSGELLSLAEHLATPDGEASLNEHVCGGGTYAEFAAAWKAERDAAARRVEITDEIADQVLALTLSVNDRTWTVRGYLGRLLGEVWAGDGDGHYGWTGESDWRYDIYEAMRVAGLIPGWRDGYGLEKEDEKRADQLVLRAIGRMGGATRRLIRVVTP